MSAIPKKKRWPSARWPMGTAAPDRFSNSRRTTCGRGSNDSPTKPKASLPTSSPQTCSKYIENTKQAALNYSWRFTNWRTQMANKRIADLFDIKSRFLRSAHLERDFQDPGALNGY